ncbi:MAG TPA: hypothetical protein VK249_11235 [Anaerolineales bacterium]|nr:hypothetical protein [Anaerolineales bacterium]
MKPLDLRPLQVACFLLLILVTAVVLVPQTVAARTTALQTTTPPIEAGLAQTTTNPVSEAQPYVVGWGTLTIINAGLAQGKNRSGLNWFLLSVLFGPIATLVLVAFFPKLPSWNDGGVSNERRLRPL